MERWVPLLGYPGYSVSDLGQVRNDKREYVLTPLVPPNKRPFVRLTLDGIQVSRSVSKLVCESFHKVPPPNFTTPIHFDGDLRNCRVDNLAWRPRWFANEHTEQFRRRLYEYPDPILEIRTRELFENCWMAVMTYGLLYLDLVRSIREKTYVFPTMQMYEWV
jgi:hypothetical protein